MTSSPFDVARTGTDPFAASANPFTIATEDPDIFDVPDDAPSNSYTYSLIKSAPQVPAEEVELSNVSAVEVMVLWGNTVLHVEHLTPPRPFYVGEEASENIHTDFFIPAESLGETRMPIVLGDASATQLVIAALATGFVELPGEPRMTLDQARAKGEPCAQLSGAHQLQLPAGSRARIEVGNFVFQIGCVNAGKPVAHGLFAGLEAAVLTTFLLTFAAAGGLIGGLAFFTPELTGLDEDGPDKQRLILMQQYLSAVSEADDEEQDTEQVADNDSAQEGGTGERATGEEGAAGKPDSQAVNKRYAVKGPKNNPDPHLSKAAALQEAREFGLIGLLNGGTLGDPQAPVAEWGRDTSLGTDDVSAIGGMWGDEIGEGAGTGGLGLSGIGEGAGGKGFGIGLGDVGGLGHGAGNGLHQGFGSGHGRLQGGHDPQSIKAPRMGKVETSGRLPPEVIQRIVRQNYGRFRLCYENGLRGNPNLAGRVAVRFVIGANGAVSAASNGGSDLPDSGVVSCVVRAFYGLSFPEPEGGIVTVVYPIMFNPN